MKKLITFGIFIGGLVGGGIGTLLDHGNQFGIWTILLSTVGSLGGIWLGIQLNNYF